MRRLLSLFVTGTIISIFSGSVSGAFDTATVTVNVSSVIDTISDRLYGENIAIWTDVINGSNTNFNNKMIYAGTKYYRWPGGSYGDLVAWDSTQQGTYSWCVSYDSTLSMLKKVGGIMQPIVNFSGYWGGVQHTHAQAVQKAAAWVKNYNITRKLGAKYWEIGNEIFGSWEQGDTTGAAYGQLFCDFYTAMKAVDSTIKIGAVVTTPLETDYDQFSNNALGNMKSGGVIPDFLIIHEYPYGQLTSVSYQNDTAVTGEWIDRIDSQVTTAKAWAKRYLGSANFGKVEYFYTEFNADRENGSQESQFLNAMYISQALMEFARLGVTGANPWCADYYTTDGNPTWYVRPMFVYHYGKYVVNTSIGQSNIRTHAWAARDTLGNVTMFLANNSVASSCIANIVLKGCNAGTAGEKWVIQGVGGSWQPEFTSISMNGTTSPSASSIKTLSGQSFTSSTSFSVTLPAYSMTWLKIPVSNISKTLRRENVELSGKSINIRETGRGAFSVSIMGATVGHEAWTVNVYDFAGKSVYYNKGNGHEAFFKLEKAASGIYFCKINYGEMNYTRAVVVK
jgi:hypothetical protein